MASRTWTEEELKKASDSLEGRPAEDAVRWAVENFHPDMALACSFGAEDVALVHMLAGIKSGARVFYIDTDLNFRETLEVRDALAKKYDIRLERVAPEMSLADMEARHGKELWKTHADQCCNIRKVVPLVDKLSTLGAWITGIRRDQAPTRANSPVVSWDAKFKLVKINPLVRWTSEDVWTYIRANNVPYNVLHDRNYPSIGCEPCTNPVMPGQDPRSGRWAGSEKTECGLHK